MKKETLRADGIISALLDFSRKLESHFVSINLNQIIEETLSKISPPPGVRIVRDLGDMPTIFADHEQLKSVFLHLISNGIQAMPERGTLRVKTSQEDEFVEVRVSDTGFGISKKNLKKIFEPLFSTKSFGVGLGLCIAKRLIENHGGIIKVQSKPNVGSTFITRLPIERRRRGS